MDLPEECWELIFRFIDQDDYRSLESLSLVSTSFLSITNRVRSTFTVTDRTLSFLHRHLLRFHNLKRVRFHEFHGDIDTILLQLSLSGSDLESLDISGMHCFPDLAGMKKKMSNVKEFSCSGVSELREIDLIGLCFPSLQKLDISYPDSLPSPVVDSAIISLSSNLKNLLTINVSGNNLITDKSLISLSQNCVLLREIIFRDCDFVSSRCIEFVLRNSRYLESLAINGIGWRPREAFSKDAFLSCRCLSELDLSESFLSDELLRLVAEAKLPLKKLVLSSCQCLTFDGVLHLLSKYQTLLHLSLVGSSFLSDEMVMELVVFLGRLTFVNFSFCAKLTGVSFFNIVERCASLECMRMEWTNFGVEELGVKSRIKSLYISGNHNLRDECLLKISRHCPFLETLQVDHCPGITEDGILEVLRNCGELKSLDISGCTGIRSLDALDFDIPKLESLTACGTWIDDQALGLFSKRCPRLLRLDLKGCLNVRSRGVKEVVKSCTRLREINLINCQVDDGIFTWMVCANPSLRRIVTPCWFSPSKKLHKFFLRHGCVICHDP